MAKGRKSGGKNWKKGQTGNPKGRPSIPCDIKEARKLTQLEFERICNKFLFADKKTFEMVMDEENQNITMLELLIAKIIYQGILEGDERRLNFIMDRLIGRVVIPLSGPNGETPPIYQLIIPSNGFEESKDIIDADYKDVTSDAKEQSETN